MFTGVMLAGSAAFAGKCDDGCGCEPAPACCEQCAPDCGGDCCDHAAGDDHCGDHCDGDGCAN